MTIPTPTTASKVGIVFSTGKKHQRGHIYVDSDAEWPAIQAAIQATPGLSLTFVPMSSHLAGPDQFHQDIATAIGVPTAAQLFTDPRCAVIDAQTLLVEQVIMADDSLDTLPGKILVNDSQAMPGFSWNTVTKQFTTLQVTLPIKPGRPTAVIVPPTTYSPSP